MPSFDLLRQPWIPVRHVGGTGGPAEIGLAELFTRAHEISDITLPIPPAASGLWRILYLIAARITGLGDLDAVDSLRSWKRDRGRVLAAGRFDPESANRYFAAHEGRFDLFHTGQPWLQDARLAAECAKSSGVNKLVVSRASGNNLVWLSHTTDLASQPLRAAEAAWHLLAWLYYGPSGKTIASTVAGRTESNMTSGPLRSRISFHPLGRDVFQSLIAGIPYPDPSSGRPDADLAPWEEDELADPLGPPLTRAGLSGPLTGRFRHALLLTPSPDGTRVTDARITWAWRMPHAEIADPYLIYETRSDGRAPFARYARADRAVWRDIDALLLQDTGSGRTRRPAVFDHLPDHSITGKLRVRAFGFDQDGQVNNRQWFTAVTPPVLLMRDTGGADPAYDGAAELAVARVAAERVAGDLKKAFQRAWAALNPTDGQGKTRSATGDGPWLAAGMARYWEAAETAFWHMVDHPGESGYPNNTFIRLALAAYDEATDHHANRGPRVARALERARGGVLATWSPAERTPLEATDA